MNTTLTGGTIDLSSKTSEVSTMLIVRVPSGTRSGRWSRENIPLTRFDFPIYFIFARRVINT
jgi:hypothetical protein